MNNRRSHTPAGPIWGALATKMRPGRWYELSELYDIVASAVDLVPGDFEPDAPGSKSPRWERNVRNVLQRRKKLGYIDWNGHGRYRLAS